MSSVNSTSDLSRKSGDIIAEALPGADRRKAHRLETMPDDLFEDAKAALAAYESEADPS